MAHISAPLHTATINGKPVRFFRTPLKDGLPDFPWHSVDDLYAALNVNKEMAEQFLRAMRGHPEAAMQTIATPDGLTTVAAHFMAQGLVDSMVHVKHAPPNSRQQYNWAIFEAGEVLESLIPGVGSFEYTMAAFKRWNGGAK